MAIVTKATEGRPKRGDAEPKAQTPGADVAGEEQALATRDTALAQYDPADSPRNLVFPAGSGLSGDWDEGDISLPTLRLARGSGESTAEFTEGSLLLGDDLVLDPPNLRDPKPEHCLRFIPYDMNKRWRMHLTDDEAKAGMRAEIVDSKEEVAARGGTIYKDQDARQWKRCCDIRMLVEAPEGCDHPGFALDLDGKQFAHVIYYARGTDFYGFAKDIFQCVQTVLFVVEEDEEGKPKIDDRGRPVRVPRLWKHFWSMRVIKRAAGDFQVYTPKVSLLPKETPGPETTAYIQNLLGI